VCVVIVADSASSKPFSLYIMSIMNEIKNGRFISYHENGKIMEEGYYIDGKLEGVFNEYDEDGNLIVQSNWKNHMLNGKLTCWRDVRRGILSETTIYKDNIKIFTNLFDYNSVISASLYYDSLGQCIKSIEYKRLSGGGVVIATTTSDSYEEDYI